MASVQKVNTSLPPGVEVRGNNVRIQFQWQRKRHRKTVANEATPSNIRFASELLSNVKRAIKRGEFDYETFFPNSKRSENDSNVYTFKDACDDYVDAKLSKLSPASASQYSNALSNVWQKIIDPATAFIDIDHATIAAAIGRHPWRSAKLYNNYLIPLRGVFDMQYRGEWTASNPMIGIENDKVQKKKPDPLSIKEREKILEHMRKHYPAPVHAYFLFAFSTGMRPEELIALRWSDIDFPKKEARVWRVRTFRGTDRETTKTDVERDVFLISHALVALKIMKPITCLGEDPHVFEHPVLRKPWHDERAQRDTYWRPTLTALGIRWRRPYCTRHTYATVALMQGVTPAFIAKQLGHSLQELLSTYAKWTAANKEANDREKRALESAFTMHG